MPLNIIKPDYAGCAADNRFDSLGKKAAGLLADLLPLAHVDLQYKTDFSQDSHLTSEGILHTSVMRVPGEACLWREITIRIDTKGRQFLGAAPAHTLSDRNLLLDSSTIDKRPAEDISLLLNLPREAGYVAAVCEEVLRAWTENLGAKIFEEIELSAATQFPLWVVSHIVAGIHYSFAAYNSVDRKKLARTITKVLEYFEDLASTKVEHLELSHGILIAPAARTAKPLLNGVYPDDFQTLKRTPFLADGIRSALWISPEGEPIEWLSQQSFQTQTKNHATIQYNYGDLDLLATASEILKGVSIALNKNGSIIIIAGGKPLFVRRSGRWRGIIWRSVKEVIGRKRGKVAMLLFDAALLLSTRGQGGILGIVSRIPKEIHEKDRVDLARKKNFVGNAVKLYAEWLFHSLLPYDEAVRLGPEKIAMLAAIDGATLFNETGQLIAYGAVLPMRPSGSEGTRSAAARELSEQGFVIKVSVDGPITLYEGGQEIVEI